MHVHLAALFPKTLSWLWNIKNIETNPFRQQLSNKVSFVALMIIII